MAPKVMKKPAAAKSEDEEYFVLYVHWKFKKQEEERIKLHIPKDENPERRSLEDIFSAVVEVSSINIDDAEEAVALQCTKFYLPDGTELTQTKKSLKRHGVKSGDKIGMMTEEYQIHATADLFVPDTMTEAPQAKKQKEATHSMVPPEKASK